MNDEQLRALLQSGQITPSQYEMFIQQMNIGGRGMDTPQERDMLQGLLGQGGQQMGQATTEPEWQPPKYEMPPPRPVDPMQGQQSPAPTESEILDIISTQGNTVDISQRGAPTQNENDFLGQFVNNAKKAMGGRPNIDTPQQRDYLQNIMQGYNKRY